MHCEFLALALIAPLGPALAQSAIPFASEPGAPTCSAFMPLDLAGQVALLQTIQPLGDEIDPADEAFARQWAGEVAAACAGHPERPLADAATAALGAD